MVTFLSLTTVARDYKFELFGSDALAGRKRVVAALQSCLHYFYDFDASVAR